MTRLMGLCLLCAFPACLAAQDATLIKDKLVRRYVSAISEKSEAVLKGIDKHTDRYLTKLAKEEAVINSRLAKINPAAARNLFSINAAPYASLKQDLSAKAARLQRTTGQYFAWNDSAATTLQFLSSKLGSSNKWAVAPDQFGDAIAKVKALGSSLQQAENVQDIIRQRQAFLQEQLKKYNISGVLKKYNTTAYYYAQQMGEYKNALSDETKAEQLTLKLLNQYAPFRSFFESNGALAGLFNLPATGDAGNLTGLQTVSQMQGVLQSRITSMGPEGIKIVQAGLSSAQNALASLRNRLNSGADYTDIPSFIPNKQKTKPLSKRLLYGLDLQNSPGNNFLPNYIDIGLSLGLKFTDRLTTGVGMSYKLGYGKDLKHIRFSNIGLGFRSYIDWKIKKGFFLSGGAEINYLSAFDSIKELQDYNAWKKAALLGFSKTFTLKTKVFKNTKFSLLYNFLHAQVPRTQTIVFRTGYNF